LKTGDAKKIHVISRQGGWAVKREGGKRAYRICSDREEATCRAIHLAIVGVTGEIPAEIIVHNEDGTVKKKIEVKLIR